MGRGRSKAGGGSQGVSGVLTLSSGEQLDLAEMTLQYGQPDSAIDSIRTQIETFENKRYKNKIEYSMLVTDDGTVVETNRGGRGSVAASYNARMKADVLTHNHPREEGILGGTFSSGDLNNFATFNQHTYRATAKEGTYSITKGKNFNGRQLYRDYRNLERDTVKQSRAQSKQIVADYKAGKIDYNTAIAMGNALDNKMLISYHNFLLQNQKKYGYTYTLEKR